MEGDGYSSTEGFVQGQVLGNYHLSVVLSYLKKKPQMHSWYGEGILSVTVSDPENWAIEVNRII